MELAQEGQARRLAPVEQNQDNGEVGLLHPLVERLVIFDHLPRAETVLADIENEGAGIGDGLGQLRQPISAGAQRLGREEYLGVGDLAAKEAVELLDDRKVNRVVAQKPAPHEP